MKQVKVGLGTCGISAGGENVFKEFVNEVSANDLDYQVVETGCIGMCYDEVLVEVNDGEKSYLYSKVTPERAKKIVWEHLIGNNPITEWIGNGENKAFFEKQERIVLRNCGIIDPRSIEEYIERGGYQAIEKVLKQYDQRQVIDLITRSGLRGRGGGGFSTGMKWKFANEAVGDQKYIICNADEGDPGAFMDRSVLEGDPHAVLEGMMVAAYAIGASEGYIYCRAEYPLAIKRLKIAIKQCEEKGYLGHNIFGTEVNLKIKIKEGAAYPGTTEPARAVPVEVRQGGETSGIDITFLDSTGVTVRGRILRNPTARPVKHLSIDLSPRNPGGRTAFVPPPAAADGDGNFQIHNVLPGSYMLTVSWDDGDRRHAGRQTVEVANADVDGVIVVIDSGLELSGILRVEGDPPLDLTSFRVSLSSTGEAPLGTPESSVGPDGKFLLKDIEADTYGVAVSGLSGSLYLKSATLGGHDVLGPGLDLTTGIARGPLEILLSPDGGRIEGNVLSEQRSPWPGARVVLVPEGVLRPRTDLCKETNTDAYGHFTLTGVPPGEYKLFAWRANGLESYQDPDFLRLYEGQGVPVTVEEKGILTMQLSLLPSRSKLP